MRRLLWMIFCVCLANPVFAQDVDLGLGGDASSLLNLPAPRGNTPARGGAARGGAAGRGANAAPVDRLVRLRDMFAGANMSLTKEQETALNNQSPGPASLPSMDELAPEIIRLNDELLGKVSAAPGLSPEQQAFIKKLYKDQVKSRGGLDAIKLTLQDAGAPFTAEQIVQIQPLFDEQNRARLQLLKDSQGQPPDKTKIDQLQRDTLGKVLKLLNPAQRAALLAK